MFLFAELLGVMLLSFLAASMRTCSPRHTFLFLEFEIFGKMYAVLKPFKIKSDHYTL